MIDLLIQLIIQNKEAIGTFLVTTTAGLLKRWFDRKKIKDALVRGGMSEEQINNTL